MTSSLHRYLSLNPSIQSVYKSDMALGVPTLVPNWSVGLQVAAIRTGGSREVFSDLPVPGSPRTLSSNLPGSLCLHLCLLRSKLPGSISAWALAEVAACTVSARITTGTRGSTMQIS